MKLNCKKLKRKLKNISNEQTAEYIEGTNEITSDKLLDENSEAAFKFLEELLDGNRFMKIRELTTKFYNEFFPAFP